MQTLSLAVPNATGQLRKSVIKWTNMTDPPHNQSYLVSWSGLQLWISAEGELENETWEDQSMKEQDVSLRKITRCHLNLQLLVVCGLEKAWGEWMCCVFRSVCPGFKRGAHVPGQGDMVSAMKQTAAQDLTGGPTWLRDTANVGFSFLMLHNCSVSLG